MLCIDRIALLVLISMALSSRTLVALNAGASGSGRSGAALALRGASASSSAVAATSQRLLLSSMRASQPLQQQLRALSTSPRTLLATPTTGPTQIHSAANPTPPITQTSTLDAHGAQRLQAESEEGQVRYPDYSKGPSALDKASQLFFFTEILRGMWITLENFFR